MEDIGQLIFVVLFILFGLISSSKKKKAPPKPRVRDATRASPSRPRAQEGPSTDAALPVPPVTPNQTATVVKRLPKTRSGKINT